MNPQSLFIAALFLMTASADPDPRGRHVIDFQSPDLYPEGLAYDPTAQVFVVGSTRHRKIVSVSDAGVVEPLITDPDLPPNSAFLGLAVDGQRLLAVVNAPTLSALAAYDLRSKHRVFLSVLSEIPNSVAVDSTGNAYVTSSVANLIWKITPDGTATVFSNSSAFHSSESSSGGRGLSGIAYVSKGYFLVVQSSTGKLFKVSERDGIARRVPLGRDLPNADNVVVRRDGALAVVSAGKAWVVKSEDSFGEGSVAAEIELEAERFATSLAVVKGRGVYALFGQPEREGFAVEEIRWGHEDDRDDRLWLYVLLGFGLVYFMVWRFQMKALISNMDKKIH